MTLTGSLKIFLTSSSRSFILPPGPERQDDSIFWVLRHLRLLLTYRVYISLGSPSPTFNVPRWIHSVLCVRPHKIMHCSRYLSASSKSTLLFDLPLPPYATLAAIGLSLNPFDPPEPQLRSADSFSRLNNVPSSSSYSQTLRIL